MRALAITALLVLCAVGCMAESQLSGIETIEPVFVEEASETVAAGEVEVEGFPHVLSKKMQKTTVEPRYYGENPNKLKQYVTPEYAAPKVLDPRKIPKHPRVFTSHYFSPLPKVVKGKKLRVSRNKKGRKQVPFRSSVRTYLGERMAKKGFTEAELRYGRLPNKFDDPKARMKNTMAPAPTPSFMELSAEEAVEVDTTEEMEALEGDNSVAPPPFSSEEVEGNLPTMINSAEEFYQAGWSAPSWTDEEASVEEENADVDADAQAEAEHSEYEDMEAEVALIEAVAEENDEAEDEETDEAEEAETDEAEEEEADETEEEEADETEEEEEESDESEEEAEEVSLVETSAEEVDEAEDEIEDEMAVNEAIVSQVDMDATNDEAGIVEESDSAEESEAADEADMDANEVAASMVEEDQLLDSADNLLVEIDAHLAENEEGDAEVETETQSESETETETETGKGTPGSSIAAGQTWEQAQNARLDAIEEQIAAEKASLPKVEAKVVATQDLAQPAANEQEPEYETEAAAASTETTAPELVDAAPSAQQVLLEKIAKLKAIRRN